MIGSKRFFFLLLILFGSKLLGSEVITIFASASGPVESQETISDSDSHSIAEGEILVINSALITNTLGSGINSSSLSRVSITKNGKTLFLPVTENSPDSAGFSAIGLILAGPLTIEASTSFTNKTSSNSSNVISRPALVTFTVYTQSEFMRTKNSSVATASVSQTNSVVIPTDAAGPVNVVMETSADMITWNAANPGLYGASDPSRFFRIRAVFQE